MLAGIMIVCEVFKQPSISTNPFDFIKKKN